MKGKLVIVSAPSGAGKTTIIKYLLENGLGLEFSVSACSRKMRPGEANGKDYYFLSAEEFRRRIENNDFLEWEEVYENSFYGTLKSEVDRITTKGNHVIFDVDVQGGMNIKKEYGERAISIFIQPPSLDELEKRLRMRSTDSEAAIQTRVNKAAEELSYANHFDLIIINDDLEKAQKECIDAVSKFLSAL